MGVVSGAGVKYPEFMAFAGGWGAVAALFQVSRSGGTLALCMAILGFTIWFTAITYLRDEVRS